MSSQAVAASQARVVQPRRPKTLAASDSCHVGPDSLDDSDTFMTKRQRHRPFGQRFRAISDVHVRMANTAGFQAKKDFVRPRRWDRQFDQFERRSLSGQACGLHEAAPSRAEWVATGNVVGKSCMTLQSRANSDSSPLIVNGTFSGLACWKINADNAK
jgi:hypothetical protein